jgi:hypothetical protein
MSAPIPTTEPAALVAGDTAKWSRALPDYPADDGWVLSYTLVNANNRYSFAATASGADHAVSVAATTTANYAPGSYDWRAQVAKTGEVFTVGAGQLVVQPSFASATDGRSSARKSLDQVQAYLADANNLQAAEYEIAGRRLKRLSIPDLLALQSNLQLQVKRETVAQRAAAGLPDPSRVMVRFSR